MGGERNVSTSLVGRQIDGRYRVDRIVGHGGYGVVCKGSQESVDRRVAIKLLLPEHASDHEMHQRFAREARLASRIRSRYVVQLLDFGFSGEVPYIVMEWLDGPTLKEVFIEAKCLPWKIVALIGRDIARGLEATHELGLAHRDLKPSNVILSLRRDSFHPVLVDFGLAKAFLREEDPEDETITRSNMMVGTPAYMAPEIVTGDDADGRGDIYALGILLTELLTGKLPFRGRTQIDTATQHLIAKRPRAEFFARSGAPEDFVALVISMLDREPSSRPQTAEVTAAQLDRFASELSRDELEAFVSLIRQHSETSTSHPSTSSAGAEPSSVDSRQLARLTTLLDRGSGGAPVLSDMSAEDASLTPVLSANPPERVSPGASHQQTIAPERTPATELHIGEATPGAASTSMGIGLIGKLGLALLLLAIIAATLASSGLFEASSRQLPNEHTERAPRLSTTSSAGTDVLIQSSPAEAALETEGVEATHEKRDRDGLETEVPEHAQRPGGVAATGSETTRPTAPNGPEATLPPAPLSTETRRQPNEDVGAHIATAAVEPARNEPGARPPEAETAASPAEERGPGTASGEADDTENVAPNASAPDASREDTSARETDAPFATVSIRLRPWAEVFINGRSHGVRTSFDLQPGSGEDLEIRAVNGDQSQERIVSPSRNPQTVRFLFID